ncbi:MAG: hypothetical protein J1F35_08440 [Erysipelotrichales bacterium]|nr:hypothetical protein [Erysipelotrichales bacterium]
MKNRTFKTEELQKENNVVFHMDKIEATLANKPYIVPASKSGTYSKLEKAQKQEEKKLKKELKDYTKYNR